MCSLIVNLCYKGARQRARARELELFVTYGHPPPLVQGKLLLPLPLLPLDLLQVRARERAPGRGAASLSSLSYHNSFLSPPPLYRLHPLCMHVHQ